MTHFPGLSCVRWESAPLQVLPYRNCSSRISFVFFQYSPETALRLHIPIIVIFYLPALLSQCGLKDLRPLVEK